MASVEISFLTGFKSLITSYIFHHFYTISFSLSVTAGTPVGSNKKDYTEYC